jgi:hypothetical protein
MRRHFARVAVIGIAVAATLIPAVASAAQGSPSPAPIQVSPLPMPSQQPTMNAARPIVGGHHIQPGGTQLRDFGIQAPSRQQTQEMDRLDRQLLEESQTRSGVDD